MKYNQASIEFVLFLSFWSKKKQTQKKLLIQVPSISGEVL